MKMESDDCRNGKYMERISYERIRRTNSRTMIGDRGMGSNLSKKAGKNKDNLENEVGNPITERTQE